MKKRSILVAPKMFCAVMFLALCGLITPAAACWTVELSSNKASFPRDNNSTAIITATVKQGGVAKSGETVSFSVTGPGTLSATSAGPTNGSGQCQITVKSSDTSESSAQITVTGTCQGASGPVNVTANGLIMTLNSTYSKIYIASTYHTSTGLTCRVKDTTDQPAIGTINFTASKGTLNPTTFPLNGAGEAYTTLTPANEGGTSTVTSTLGSVYKPTDVLIADHTKIVASGDPQKELSNCFIAQATLYDQENIPYPGADVSFQWQVANDLNQTDVIRTQTPTGDVVGSSSPVPTGDGWGGLVIYTARISTSQATLKSTAPTNWGDVNLRYKDAVTIKIDSEARSPKVSVNIDLECVAHWLHDHL